MTRDSIAQAAERFARDIGPHERDEMLPWQHIGPLRRIPVRAHEMTILHDDGLYRHLLFKSPDTSCYWFELVTWPGRLSIHGDLGDAFTFARVPDMFTFFRRHEINPVYWSEKLDGGRGPAMVHSGDLFERNVWNYVRGNTEGRPGLAKAVQAHFFGQMSEYDVSSPEQARSALESFEYPGWDGPDGAPPFSFGDAWEWDSRDWDWTFLWACHAIVFGIARYDEAKQAGAVAA